MRRRRIADRWLGAGLAAVLAVVTLGLAVSGQLALYISPSSNWFAVPMAVLLLIGAALSCMLPLGAEHAHGNAHGHDDEHEPGEAHRVGGAGHRRSPRRTLGAVASVAGGAAATVIVLTMLVAPPAALSAEIAQTRSTGAAPLFAGADVVALATRADTAAFGVGDWATVFASATDTDAFEGDRVSLVGFVTPAAAGGTFALTRLVITHCVIDAQTANIAVASADAPPATGQWVRVVGTVRSARDGRLQIEAASVTRVPQPKDPYEY